MDSRSSTRKCLISLGKSFALHLVSHPVNVICWRGQYADLSLLLPPSLETLRISKTENDKLKLLKTSWWSPTRTLLVNYTLARVRMNPTGGTFSTECPNEEEELDVLSVSTRKCIDELRKTYFSCGVRGLYRGFFASFAAYHVENGVSKVTYRWFRNFSGISNNRKPCSLQKSRNIISKGMLKCMSRLVGLTIAFPLWTITKRMILFRSPWDESNTISFSDMLKLSIYYDSSLCLYQGYLPAAVRVFVDESLVTLGRLVMCYTQTIGYFANMSKQEDDAVQFVLDTMMRSFTGKLASISLHQQVVSQMIGLPQNGK